MNKLTTLLVLAAMPSLGLSAQTTITREQARTMYTTQAPTRVSVHDPSVVWDSNSNQFYIFGSHRAQAKTTDLYHWSFISPAIPWGIVSTSGAIQQVNNQFAFDTPQVKTVTKGGVSYDLPAFSAEDWSALASTNYNVDGNMWAPDIIYNKAMKKWCQYLSINGDNWASSIILLTADKIEGPYVYQAPVVISGFNGTNANDYKNTDLEIVLGTQTSLPSRYAKGSSWGTTWPNNIDPCVFYDEEGNLWMTYGSWSGGIFSLQLDENTGLRDYDVSYPLTGSGNNYTSDPYFGKKIAGGFYVSGEASYVKHIGNYYYLFMTYGGLTSDGGYEMEVFRSQNPDGPFIDPRGTNAVYASYQKNFGTGSYYRGAKLFSAYGDWGFMSTGTASELSQGHNSAITDAKGRSFVVYHTRFNDGTEGHQVRVHQLFTTPTGWLAAAPFEFTGETATDSILASEQIFDATQVAGTYQILIHKQQMDYANKELVKPVTVTLNADGTITGAYTGNWSLVDGTSYINVTVGGLRYQGVVVEQQMEPYTIKAIAFTGINSLGTAIWGYKMEDKYRLAYIANKSMPVKDGDIVNYDLNLMGLAEDGLDVEWTSSNPDVISNTGVYNSSAMTAETMPVDLVVKITSGDYQFVDTVSVTAVKSNADYWTGAQAYYPFDQLPAINAFNTTQTAALKSNGTATAPTLATDAARNGKVLHTNFGAAGYESYVQMTNPLNGSDLTNGFTVSMMVNRVDDNLWDDLFSFYNSSTGARLYMTGNTYVGYNSNAGNWIDLNHSSAVTTNNIPVGQWSLVTVTVSADGVNIYVDGVLKNISAVNGSQNGSAISSASQFNYSEILTLVKNCPNLYLGYGSFWGSTNVYYDDLMVFDRVLSADDILSLNAAERNGHDFTGIDEVTTQRKTTTDNSIYNLSGQRVGTTIEGLPRGIYIRQGKKFIVK
ncbi:MAG: family 43 glycosylhydrolase [Prevotella sp.]|nr:family 43 glycosylhydrolase [Prevotella sp.]